MPKKTKKEKLLALYHKKLKSLENRSATPQVEITYRSQKQIPVQKQEEKVIPVTSEDKLLNKYFFSDLKKSLILIVLIIGVEVSLYAAHLIK